MDAERAWSHAMELKLLANTELRKKFHYIRRLRKAASHANQLEELCYAEACDARTKLEAQVYNSPFRTTDFFNFVLDITLLYSNQVELNLI